MLKEPSLVHIIRTGRLSVGLVSSLSSSGGSNHFLDRCTSMSRSPKRRNEGTRLPRQMMGRKQNSGPAIQNSDDTIIGELHSRSVPRGPKEPTEKKPASVCFYVYSPATPARNLRESFREGVQSLCLRTKYSAPSSFFLLRSVEVEIEARHSLSPEPLTPPGLSTQEPGPFSLLSHMHCIYASA